MWCGVYIYGGRIERWLLGATVRSTEVGVFGGSSIFGDRVEKVTFEENFLILQLISYGV